MNTNEVFKENQKTQEIIEKILQEKFSKANASINIIDASLDNYIEEECLENAKDQKEMQNLLNKLCYEFSGLFNKAKFINESIILKNNSVQYQFNDLNLKMINPPSVLNIDANINYISIITQKFYNVIQIKYENKNNLFKTQLEFMHLSPNRILNNSLLSENDNILLHILISFLN
ncbi:hypothetical protein KPL37_04685 [Clostridium frigoris]|uniref:Uncharacterized protein n=1 Tax=Clostridium frigoris TaxID=205327 RepID=A0ABS6BSU4_9CLOT|nr:hypothetical protein [Clostridium frigoris]MBU3159054.1 hypothetical protein [Clostridium frigoris]